MDVAFTRLSYWLWGTKDHERTNSVPNSSSDFPFQEPDSIKFLRSSSRRMKRKWQSREERRVTIDREYDVVIVPSDGEFLSGSESEESDWSIGWMEPHAPDFQSNAGDSESSFAVLVPCYGRGRCEKREILKGHVLGAVTELNLFSSRFLQGQVHVYKHKGCGSLKTEPDVPTNKPCGHEPRRNHADDPSPYVFEDRYI